MDSGDTCHCVHSVIKCINTARDNLDMSPMSTIIIKTWSDRGLRADACIGCRFVDMPLIISVLWLLCETGPCYYAWRGTRHLNMRGCQYIAGFFYRYPKVNISKHIWYVRRRRRQWIAEIAENCILTNISNKKTTGCFFFFGFSKGAVNQLF